MRTSFSLPGDRANTAATLSEHLTSLAGSAPVRKALAEVVEAIAQAAALVAARLALGSVPGDPKAIVGLNESGDEVKLLDLAAHDHFLAALSRTSVQSVLSEESKLEVDLAREGLFNVAIDPIDGSGSIGIGAPLGTLFCVFPSEGGFLRAGREILAAGYVSYGHTIDFGFSLGDGVNVATLNPSNGEFYIEECGIEIPLETNVVAFNASNRRHWADDIGRYIDDCVAGCSGPRGKDFNMRWIAAAVGDLHRIIRRGGLSVYPSDAREGYEFGFLRLAYEAFPIAWIIERAGGAASDGSAPILDLVPDTLHARTPLFFGSRNEMAVLQSYLNK